jgi:hypothetical protein
LVIHRDSNKRRLEHLAPPHSSDRIVFTR